MARRSRPAQVRPGALVPAPQARRRSAVIMALSLSGLTMAVVVPAVILRLLRDNSALPILVGTAPGFCLWLLRESGHARRPWHLDSAGSCFLTAHTWTGRRTVDLRNLKSIRARKIAWRGKPAYYLIVRDAAGVRLALSEQADISLTRRMLHEQLHREHPSPVTVSRLGKAVLGIKPARTALSVTWSTASVMLFAITVWFPVLICFLIRGS